MLIWIMIISGRDPEDSSSFLCSLYGLVGNVFSVGRAVGSVSKVAEKIISGEPNADFWTYGDSVRTFEPLQNIYLSTFYIFVDSP